MLPLISPPLQDTHFSLNISGVAGLFGGDEVVEATSTLHIYKGRKLRGWYNSPGAYTVAKYFGSVADSRLWRGVFPGASKDPASAFGLDGQKGPKYIGVLSGTELITGHTGYLLTNYVKDHEEKNLCVKGDRTTAPTSIAIINIISVEKVDNLITSTPLLQLIFSYFTMLTSVACAIFSLILFNDTFSFVAILIGTLIGGVSCLIIGMGSLSLVTVFEPAPGAPPGDGVLIGREIIVLRGSEADVNAITKGRFRLDLTGPPKYHIIGFCSTLYLFQFIAQLFIIPQGTLPGQIMFLISFAIAWINNCILASIDRDVVQRGLLLQSVKLGKIAKFKLPNRTMAAFFACLSLWHSTEDVMKSPVYGDFRPEQLLEAMLPNDTRVWWEWRRIVVHILQLPQPPESFVSVMDDDSTLSDLRKDQRVLLSTLLKDAESAYWKYNEIKESLDIRQGTASV